MRTMSLVVGGLIAAALSWPGAAPAAGTCFDLDESEPMRFQGRLKTKTYPGAPNTRSIRAGDEAETVYILTPTRPVCAFGGPSIDEEDAPKPTDRIDRIHVYAHEDAVDAQLAEASGHEVIVTSTHAFGAFTQHHRAPLVVEAASVVISK